MTNYPPGTSRRDLERAGIIDHEVQCPECGAIVSHGEDHEDWCECELDVDEMKEYWDEKAMGADEYDRKEL